MAKVRKCSICKEEINLSKDVGQYFFYRASQKSENLKCSHINCYVEYAMNTKKGKKTYEECLKYIQNSAKEAQLIEYNRKKRDEEKNASQATATSSEKYKKDGTLRKDANKRELYDFIKEMYGVTYFTSAFFKKMEDVYSGKNKRLSRPVPPEDILDMWKRKRTFLEKTAVYNGKKGVVMDVNSRINYDLAILLSKYDSYLQWRQEQKNANVENENQKKQNTDFIGYNELVKNQKTQKRENKGVDICAMLDEI